MEHGYSVLLGLVEESARLSHAFRKNSCWGSFVSRRFGPSSLPSPRYEFYYSYSLVGFSFFFKKIANLVKL